MYVLKEPKEISFTKVGILGKIFPSSHLTGNTQFVLIQTDRGHETTIIEHKSDFIYYVLEGKGSFIIDGVNEVCEKGDLVVIPAGNQFTYKGSLQMLLSTTPPWNEDQEETISIEIK